MFLINNKLRNADLSNIDLDSNDVKRLDKMSKINDILKDADLSNIDLGDLDEDFKINSNLQKALGNKADQFIKFIKKLNMEHKAYDQDIHPLGLYVETRDKGTHQENVHNF